MTIDFDKIASDAKLEYEAKQRAAEEQHLKERNARRAVVQSGVDCLDTFVIPIVEAAKLAFGRQNIDVDIKRSYDVAGFASKMPSIDIQMSRLAQNRSDGYRIKSPILFVSSDGSRLFAHFSKEYGATPDIKKGDVRKEEVEDLLSKSIMELAGLFFKAIENGR
jgi:hypothetical protein